MQVYAIVTVEVDHVGDKPLNMEALKNYLRDATSLDLDIDEHGNSPTPQDVVEGICIDWESLNLVDVSSLPF